jgi:hypothetical protein
MRGCTGSFSAKFPDSTQRIVERVLKFGEPVGRDYVAGLKLKLQKLELQSGATQALRDDIVEEAVGSRAFSVQYLQNSVRGKLKLSNRRQLCSSLVGIPGCMRHDAVDGGKGN